MIICISQDKLFFKEEDNFFTSTNALGKRTPCTEMEALRAYLSPDSHSKTTIHLDRLFPSKVTRIDQGGNLQDSKYEVTGLGKVTVHITKDAVKIKLLTAKEDAKQGQKLSDENKLKKGAGGKNYSVL